MRLLLAAVARGLRSIAGRLTPVEAAPAAVVEPLSVEDTAGGPPGHWLEMVRTRAPGLHVSLQERGVVRVPRRPLPVATPEPPPVPSVSALEPRGRKPETPARRAPAATPAAEKTVLPVARPLRRLPESITTPTARRPMEETPDLEPHTWESAASDDDHEDWTRAPTRPAQSAMPAAFAPIPARVSAVRRLSTVDAVVAKAWRPSGEAPPSTTDARTDPRRVPPRPELRPLPTVTTPETTRHSTATPAFAPSRDEDQALRRLVRARVNYPTPVPTPWRIEALQATVDELVAPRFPSLPDEVASDAAVSASAPASVSAPSPSSIFSPIMRSAVSPPPAPSSLPSSVPQQAPILSARRRHDSSDLVGAWPTLPAARIPALRTSSEPVWSALPDADRWPELPGDESDEENDPDLSLPADHRGRLEREQRGLSWNG